MKTYQVVDLTGDGYLNPVGAAYGDGSGGGNRIDAPKQTTQGAQQTQGTKSPSPQANQEEKPVSNPINNIVTGKQIGRAHV